MQQISALIPATQEVAAQFVLFSLLVLIALPVAVIDLRERRIPNAITMPSALAALAVAAVVDPSGLPMRIAAGLLAGGFLLLPTLLKPGGIGMGDVKLALVMGLCLGPLVAVALFLATLAACFFGVVVAIRKGVGTARSTTVALGPFLMAGAVVAGGVGCFA